MSRIPPLAVWPAPPPPGRNPWQPDPRPPTLPPAAPSAEQARGYGLVDVNSAGRHARG